MLPGMLDTRARASLAPVLEVAGGWLVRAGVRANALTAAGFLAGVGACAAAALAIWPAALALWLANRTLDGLDGVVARQRRATDLGGFLDIVSDFTIYGGFVLGVAIARPPARLACVVLLVAYYVSGTALLALSSLAERRAQTSRDERSVRFVGGLAEGTETVVVYVLFCLFPGGAEWIAWAFAAAVAITAGQRVAMGLRELREPVAMAGARAGSTSTC